MMPFLPQSPHALRFFPVWLRIAPHTVITFIVWEKLLAWESAR